MSRRKPVDKTQIRERRNRMLASAAAARLSPTEGVREMRAISGMTQEDFARHRGVSARVVKAIELGQGNPTMATLNRIGQFFGLEVAFVPIRREAQAAGSPSLKTILLPPQATTRTCCQRNSCVAPLI
ncbi:transcriptional regulator [Massilia oculi]|uniref:Transcriptional regulator n=1 Tax=Massilia oculi TaxID=945844 RepID=A0A2S2DQA6_9BURK|nr:helix-turn-helix domain-containing protein [Massilia oculi]AWL07006.1 transcriptional regulator [Massilia oculi]